MFVVEAGIQTWKAVLAALRLLDRIKPLGMPTVAAFTRDVYHYLNNPGIQTPIERCAVSARGTRRVCGGGPLVGGSSPST